MDFELISSKSNDRIKRVNLLIRSASARRENQAFVLEGLRLCVDAMLCGIKADELYFTERALSKYDADITKLINNSSKSFLVTDDVMAKLSDTENSQGIVCVISNSALSSNDIIDNEKRYIACENLSDPSNLGAIARTAEALGISGMFLIGHCCDAYNPKAMRASMGALLRLSIYKFDSVIDFINMCNDRSMRPIASVVHKDARNINEFKFLNGDVVIIGNEANGMTDELINQCDNRVTIPIKGRAESFNAAVAASIIMWELCAE